MNPFLSTLVVILALMVSISTAVPSAYSQFSTQQNIGSGVSYTAQDIAEGKGPRTNLQQVAITSGSMLPLYEIGEYVTLDYDYPYESLKIGDVVAFIPNGSVNCDTGLMCDLVMHRIVDLNDNDMELTFTTQGDSNDKPLDLEQDISKSQYVGLIVETESFSHG